MGKWARKSDDLVSSGNMSQHSISLIDPNSNFKNTNSGFLQGCVMMLSFLRLLDNNYWFQLFPNINSAHINYWSWKHTKHPVNHSDSYLLQCGTLVNGFSQVKTAFSVSHESLQLLLFRCTVLILNQHGGQWQSWFFLFVSFKLKADFSMLECCLDKLNKEKQVVLHKPSLQPVIESPRNKDHVHPEVLFPSQPIRTGDYSKVMCCHLLKTVARC